MLTMKHYLENVRKEIQAQGYIESELQACLSRLSLCGIDMNDVHVSTSKEYDTMSTIVGNWMEVRDRLLDQLSLISYLTKEATYAIDKAEVDGKIDSRDNLILKLTYIYNHNTRDIVDKVGLSVDRIKHRRASLLSSGALDMYTPR